jgi:hypothetical protein
MRSATIQSSLITEARFDEAHNTLDVDFRSGRTYRYFMVQESVYDALIHASSAGAFFNDEIRDNYRCIRVR